MQWDLNENFDEIRQLKKDKVALEKQVCDSLCFYIDICTDRPYWIMVNQ